MKFSIIIPTQNRPQLLLLAVKYVLNQSYKNFELIISDNSTTPEMKNKNKELIGSYTNSEKVKIVSPDRELSAPGNFEFGLQFARGDYVAFLTDKMILLPNTLEIAKNSIEETGADIVNWPYIPYTAKDPSAPDKNGELKSPSATNLNNLYLEYSPVEHLKFKASGMVSRSEENMEQYIKGKICFGCYNKKLINRIVETSGSLHGGVTHDYSAMVQALCLANKAVVLLNPGIVFIGLPIDQSLGSLTCFSSSAALKYYQSFKNGHDIISSLLIPGLYSSQHNMVAHDYIKYLTLYNKENFFREKNWLLSIQEDLYLENKQWLNLNERKAQFRLFYRYTSKLKCFVFKCFYIVFLKKNLKKKRNFLICLKSIIKKTLQLLALDGFFVSRERSVSIFTGNLYTSLDEAVKSLYEKRN